MNLTEITYSHTTFIKEKNLRKKVSPFFYRQKHNESPNAEIVEGPR